MRKSMKKSLSLVLVATMAMAAMTACGKKEEKETASESASTVKAGTYTEKTQGFGGEITANVTVKEDGSIAEITVDVATETPELGGTAGPQVAAAIVEKQSLSVDTVAGATVTSTAVITAVTNALNAAGVTLK